MERSHCCVTLAEKQTQEADVSCGERHRAPPRWGIFQTLACIDASVDVIGSVRFVLKHTDISAISPHIMKQIHIIIHAQMVGLCQSAAGTS